MMSFLRVCGFIINLLILFSFAFNGFAAFDLFEKRQLEADLAQTDQDFIALLKKTIARRIYLFGPKRYGCLASYLDGYRSSFGLQCS